MPRGPAAPLSSAEAQQLEDDDLAQLLAATNAKRAARGKADLTFEEVQVQIRVTQREMRGEGGSEPSGRWDALD